jgi:hypothetical protein
MINRERMSVVYRLPTAFSGQEMKQIADHHIATPSLSRQQQPRSHFPDRLPRHHETLSPEVSPIGQGKETPTDQLHGNHVETPTDQLPDTFPPFSAESDPFHDDWPFWQKQLPVS